MPKPRILPPVYLLIAVLAMSALHAFLPVRQLIQWPWRWAGVGLIVFALVPGVSAVRGFILRKTTLKPGGVSSQLITDGPYRFTRNPMYLGMTLLLAGTAVLLGSLGPWLIVPLFVYVINHNIIPIEEAMLVEAFGEEYRQYRARVRRWF
jgi:protein-S-isoprenylcysteine O-methyltransferase Ste14